MPMVAVVTEDDIVSISDRYLAGDIGIDRGLACRGPGFGWTSPDREIRSQIQRC